MAAVAAATVVVVVLLLLKTSHNHEHKMARLSSESWWTNLYEYTRTTSINIVHTHDLLQGFRHSQIIIISRSRVDFSISSSFISANVNRFYWFVIVVSIDRWDWLMARKWNRKTEQRRMFLFLFSAGAGHSSAIVMLSISAYISIHILNCFYLNLFTMHSLWQWRCAFGTFGFFSLPAVVREHEHARAFKWNNKNKIRFLNVFVEMSPFAFDSNNFILACAVCIRSFRVHLPTTWN